MPLIGAGTRRGSLSHGRGEPRFLEWGNPRLCVDRQEVVISQVPGHETAFKSG